MQTIVLARERCNFINAGGIRTTLKVAVCNDDYTTFQRIVREAHKMRQIAPPVLRASLGYGSFVSALRCMGKYKKEDFLAKFLADKEILEHLKSRASESRKLNFANHQDDWYYVDIAVGALKGGHQSLFNNCVDKFCGGDLDRMGLEARWRITSAAIKVDNFEVANKFGLRTVRWTEGGRLDMGDEKDQEFLGGNLLVQSCVEGSKRCMKGFGAEFVEGVIEWSGISELSEMREKIR